MMSLVLSADVRLRSATRGKAALGRSPSEVSAAAGRMLGSDDLIYEGPCVDGAHNVESCGDCTHHTVELYSDNGAVEVTCSQCKAGFPSDYGCWSDVADKVHDLGSYGCHHRYRVVHTPCVDGRHHVDTCGKCRNMAEIANADGSFSVRCYECSQGYETEKLSTVAAGQSVPDLGQVGCSPVEPYYGECQDGQHSVKSCGTCKTIKHTAFFDESSEVTCMECSAEDANLQRMKIGRHQTIDDIGKLGCGQPQPTRDYEGPCVDGSHGVDKCGSCSSIKSHLRDGDKTEVECTQCRSGYLVNENVAIVKRYVMVDDMGLFGCEPSEDYHGQCIDGQHHVNACGSCAAVSLTTNVDRSVDVQCTQCRPNGRKDRVSRRQRSSVKNLGEFGCH